jgi:hypothetical protein
VIEINKDQLVSASNLRKPQSKSRKRSSSNESQKSYTVPRRAPLGNQTIVEDIEDEESEHQVVSHVKAKKTLGARTMT